MTFANTPRHDATLDRRAVIPAIVGNHEDFLFVTSLAGANYDVAAMTNYGGHAFINGGGMGCATMLGLGLALAQPSRKVMAVMGDGDLMMSMGSLATIAVAAPKNLVVMCVDNGHYGETGYQTSHTSFGVDLTGIAKASGLPNSMTVWSEDDVPAAQTFVREEGPRFLLVKVAATSAPDVKLNLNPTAARERFKSHLTGRGVGLPLGHK